MLFRSRINFLAAEGYLTVAGGQYPIVKLSPKAVPVLKGEEKVYQRQLPMKETSITDVERIFDSLRVLRRTIAQREGLPPYMIFSDSTLREMARVCPQDKRQLLRINGVGEIKLEKFGDSFLEALRDALDQSS